MPKRKNASVETEALAPAAGVTEATPPARGSTPPKRLAHDEPSGGAAAASQLSKLKRASLATLATHQLRENVGNAREVQVAIVVKKIFDLDTVNETFGCILGVTLKWKCPDGETPPESHNNDGDWEPEWTPKFAVRNTMEECVDAKVLCTTSSEPVEGRADGSEQLWVVMDGEYILRIYEALELESFPYDCQTLPIYLESRLPTTEFVLVPLKALNQPVVALSADVNNANDFDLIGEMPFGFELYVAHSDSRSAKTGRTFSGICVYVMMARHTAYYVFNVVCVMGILATMCMTAWCIHPADIPSRHGVDFTLILTAVAFKFILVDMLPKLPYLTFLDFYVVVAIAYVTAMTLIHSLLPMFHYDHVSVSAVTLPGGISDEDAFIHADTNAHCVCGACWALFNVVYGYVFHTRRRSIRSEIVESSKRRMDESASLWKGGEYVTVDRRVGIITCKHTAADGTETDYSSVHE